MTETLLLLAAVAFPSLCAMGAMVCFLVAIGRRR